MSFRLPLSDPRRAARIPGSRFIDPRGQRVGAGLSALVLLVAFGVDAPPVALLMGANLAISAAFGTRWFLPARPWRAIRAVLALGPAELEHEYPPRFAQALGAAFIGLAGIAFALAHPLTGWVLVGAVGGLQAFLAVTGICVGCRLYFLRWWVPDLFARLVGRTEPLVRTRTPLRRPDA